MPRVDRAWRTASYTGNAVEGFLLQIYADAVTGLGGTAAHPSNISADEQIDLTIPPNVLVRADKLIK